jgi:DNA-binding GntR family transcriptional regulator
LSGKPISDVTDLAAEQINPKGVRPETLTETIYERMRGDLLTGVFAPGMPMRLEDVRQRYNVKTSPLREAMFRLTAEGFPLLSSQRGFRVAPLSHEDLLDLTERRAEIEARALLLSIANGDEEWESEVVCTENPIRVDDVTESPKLAG